MERKLLVPFMSALKKVHIFKYVSTTNHKKLSTIGITIRAQSRTPRCLFSLHPRELLKFLRMTVSKMLMFNMKATVFHSASYCWRFNNSKPGFKKRSPVGWGAKDCCQHVNKGNDFAHIVVAPLSLILGSCWPCMFCIFGSKNLLEFTGIYWTFFSSINLLPSATIP